MRQRKVKNVAEKLEKCRAYKAELSQEIKGRWHELFGNGKDIYLELGCGKGKFLLECARSNTARNYIGIEGQESVVLRALEKASLEGIPNIRFAAAFIKDLREYFREGELSGIYLNFSDPWPKFKHAKRRLTHRGYLEQYRCLLREGGFVEFKTDNDALFEFTLEELGRCDFFEITECTGDLHGSAFTAKNITTEYEDKFQGMGMEIHYVKLKKTK